MDNVPYLTHMDFVKGVRELNELCDYLAIDLTHDIQASGIIQYYKNPAALEKMLKAVNTQRMLEIGKAAALEYEGQTNDDYSSSMRRIYNRNCFVSTVRPMLLMVQIDLNVLP